MRETPAPDGRPMVGPFDRAGWRAWLVDNPKSARRAMLGWVVQAKRPETRATRIAAIAEKAARKERAYPRAR